MTTMQRLVFRKWGGGTGALVVWALGAPGLSAAPAPESGAAARPLFDAVPPAESGLVFTHRIDTSHLLAYLYNSGYACGGVAIGDINGDSRPDIFLVSGPDDNALFLNRGEFRFEKSPGNEALADRGSWGVTPVMADADGDGDLDIFVTNYEAPNRLFLNDGAGIFTERGARAGLDFAGPSHTPYFADFDGDGDLDLFVLTNRLFSPFGRPQVPASEMGPDGKVRVKEAFAPYLRVVHPEVEAPPPPGGPPAPGPFLLEYGHDDRLYRNDGAGADGVPVFRNVTREAGLADAPGHGLSALIWDINRDGLPDIYVANDYTEPDRLWLNAGPGKEGAFRFRDATDEWLPTTTWSSMGSDVADVNDDGLFDFFVADMAGTTHFKAKTTMGEMTGWRRWVLENAWPRQAMRNMLFVDSGARRFQEVAFFAGLARSDWTWGAKFGDFDLDSRSDLYITNGAARVFSDSDIIVDPRQLVGRTEWDFFKDAPEMREKNLAFRNEGGLRFTDVSRAWNLDHNTMGYGAATGDLDGDGDLDIVACHLVDNVGLYRNGASANGRSWLEVRLDGEKNRHGLGAVVTVRLDDGRPLVRLMNPHTGFQASHDPVIHFGLGNAKRIAALEVRWPGGRRQLLGPQAPNRVLLVHERDASPAELAGTPSESQPAAAASPAAAETLFAEVGEEVGLDFKHSERFFDDYQREFLLPAKLSQFGPGVAVADVDGDQLDDIYVGGAAGQAGILFLQQADHHFRPLEGAPWAADTDPEDMGVLFFDADRDGDVDLFVTGGSNEWDAGDPRYAIRLYLNHMKAGGGWLPAPADSLPAIRESSSSVAAADFDRDGDLDLFIGARSVPGRYPLTPKSTLLRNDGRSPGEVNFTDATGDTAGLEAAGLVTSALWSDVDGDGWIDLLIASEWGPVRLFLNSKGQLAEATAEAGLVDRFGWWSGLAAGDFDGDGDIDYAALNAGLNTKYGQPTAAKALSLYRGDMDGNGVYDLVEAKVSADGELPIRGRSCSSTAMPFIKERFKSYKAFALANLAGIYTDERLGEAIKVSANELASGILINESKPGAPKLRWAPLPTEVQISPGFGSVAADFAGRGRPALAIAQNLASREPETGLWRGGLGSLLNPSGKDGWVAEKHTASGFVLTDDAKGLALADIDGNGAPDLVATQNDGPIKVFRNRMAAPRLAVRLAGPPGNPTGVGSRVTLKSGGRTIATHETSAGSGYLSQSTATVFFAILGVSKPHSVSVLWPDGRTTESPVESGRSTLTVSAPETPREAGASKPVTR